MQRFTALCVEILMNFVSDSSDLAEYESRKSH
jgi:hypothetical protein